MARFLLVILLEVALHETRAVKMIENRACAKTHKSPASWSAARGFSV